MPDEIHELASFEIESTVAEMGDASAEIGPDIPMNATAVAKIRSQDSDPRFIVVEIEETTASKSGRIWPGEIIRSIAEQVNKNLPVGYQGHIPEKDDATAFPDVQAMWLGAVVSHKAGRLVARVKGYLLPESKARRYAEIGAIDGVSVRGDATMSREKGGLRVKNFIMESIDFARKGRSGMPARILAVTSEMEEGGKVEPKDIAALDEQELRSHNPLLVAEIERKVTEPLNEKVSESAAAVAVAEPKLTAFSEICKKLGIEEGDDPVAAVVSLMERVEGAAKEHVKSLVDKAIKKLAGKDERAQNLVRRLVGEQIEEEFKDSDDVTEEEVEAKVKEMIEADEDVKAIVTEMSDSDGGGGGSSHTKHSKADKDDNKGRTGSLKRSKRQLA
jgi:hypothetical protein